MRSSIRYIIFPGLIALAIFYFTCIVNVDSIPVPKKVFEYDKLAHFGMFFALSAAVFIDYYLKHEGAPNGYKWLLFGLVVPVIYGGLIEIAQENFFSRTGDWCDFVADTMGSMSATIIALFYVYIKPKEIK